MFVDSQVISQMERRYGQAKVLHWQWEARASDLANIRASQKHGRAHDVTLFIFKGDKLALIRKHIMPPGVYRAPSGGLEPGEPFEDGARREAREETGLDVALKRYLLRINVRFYSGSDFVDWTSHVFEAEETGGELRVVDTKEILENRYGTLDELDGPIREALLATGRRLLAYRVALHDATIELIRESFTQSEGSRSNEASKGSR